MPQITVNNQTTVADLQKFAQQMGAGDKLRATYDKASDSYTLYTSNKGAGTGLKNYLFGTVDKRQACAQSALNKIIWNTSGTMKTTGATQVLHNALSNTKTMLPQTGDIKMGQLQPMAERALHAFTQSQLPVGVTVGQDGTLSGQVDLSQKHLGPNNSVDVDEAIQDGVDKRLQGQSAKKFTDVGGKTVHQEFLDDAVRMNFSIGGNKTNVHVVSNSQGRANADQVITTQLHNLAGTDNATKVLSSFLHQGSFNNMTGFLPQKDGSLVKLLQPPKDLNNAVFVDNHGTSHDIGKPSQYSGMDIQLSKFNDGSGDFKVTMNWDYHFSQVGTSGIDKKPLNPTDETRVGLMTTTCEIRISKEEADKGVFQMQFTQPPTATFSGILNS